MYPAERARDDGGYTFTELLIVLVILAILVAVALPSYLGAKSRAGGTSARANLRTALPAVEQFAADNVGVAGDADNKAATAGYKGMTPALLRKRYDASLPATVRVVAAKTSETSFCLTDAQAGQAWSVSGPGAPSPAYFPNAKCS